MKLSIFTNRKSTSLVFSAALLAVLLVAAGSPYALGQSQTGTHRPTAPEFRSRLAASRALAPSSQAPQTSRLTTTARPASTNLRSPGCVSFEPATRRLQPYPATTDFPTALCSLNTDDDGHFCRQTGKLIVGLRDVGGDLKQADFQVVVFKAH